MSPWEQLQWFDTLRQATTTLLPGVVGQIAAANPMRVLLVIGTQGGNPLNVGITSALSATAGIQIGSASQPPLEVDQRTWGAACAAQWFGFAVNGATVDAIEVLMRDWPDEHPQDYQAMCAAINALTCAIRRLTRASNLWPTAPGESAIPGHSSNHRWHLPWPLTTPDGPDYLGAGS